MTDTLTLPAPSAQALEDPAAALRATRDSVAARYVARETECDLIALCLAARTNLTLVGEPGLAKSALARDFARAVSGARYFEAQLAPDTPAQRVLGPYSIPDLDRGVFRMECAGMLPEAHIGLLDEGYRANGTLLDNLLALANPTERHFHNGPEVVSAPLWTLIIACNQLPDAGDERLWAFRDRMTVTRLVAGARSDEDRARIIARQLARGRAAEPALVPIDRSEVEALQARVPAVECPENFLADALRLWRGAEEAGLPINPRRFGELVRLAQARAALAGRSECLAEDLTLAEHVLWADPEDAPTAYELALGFADRAARRREELRRAHEEMSEPIAAFLAGAGGVAAEEGLSAELIESGINLLRRLKALEARVGGEEGAGELAGRVRADQEALERGLRGG